MKKLLFIVLAIVMMLSLFACSTPAPAATSAPASSAAPAASVAPASSAAPAATAAASAAVKDPKDMKIITIVKLTGITWFDRLNEGVKQFAAETGVDAKMIGPSKADVALQVQMVEDAISQNPDAISIVPLSPEAMEPVLKKAMDKGIVVISHEATNMKNMDYNIEGFDNKVYGEQMMDMLGKEMGGKGEYITLVGQLTAISHNLWEEAGVAYQEKNFPDMKAVVKKIEYHDDQKEAYDKVREAIKAHPSITGIFAMGAMSAPGAALAVEEMGLAGKVKIISTGIVSISGKYIEDGTIKAITTWDPKTSGYVMNKLALMILQGKRDQIKDGMDLGAPGYGKIILTQPNLLAGNDIVTITKDNTKDYNF